MTDENKSRGDVESAVIAQYVEHPYPPTDPKSEFAGIAVPLSLHLDILNTCGFNGDQDFSRFSVLEAGCGTGTAALYLATMFKQMAGKQRIVAIDISESSLNILRERMKIRGIVEGEDIVIIKGSILDLPNMHIGTFDLINCTGVLHHMHDPTEGLKALSAKLKPSGIMNLMVYGACGRIGTRTARDLVKLAISTIPSSEREKRLSIGQEILNQLPVTHPINRVTTPRDDKTYGSAGFQDQFDHCQEKDYDIIEVIQFLNKANLTFSGFNPINAPYFTPSRLFSGEALATINTLPVALQWLICDRAICTIFKHEFYASSRTCGSNILLDDDTIVYPVPEKADSMRTTFLLSPIGKKIELSLSNTLVIKATFVITRELKAIVRRLDGKTTIGEIKKNLEEQGISSKLTESIIKELYAQLNHTGGLCILVAKTKRLRDIIFLNPQDVQYNWMKETGYLEKDVMVKNEW